MELRRRALQWLAEPDVARKVDGVRTLAATDWRVDADAALDAGHTVLPGRPSRPQLVAPAGVPARSAFTTDGHAALLHAVAHIEFNAINLALDAVWRFAGLPPAYYHDWARVAAEEALHFSLVEAHLRSWDPLESTCRHASLSIL